MSPLQNFWHSLIRLLRSGTFDQCAFHAVISMCHSILKTLSAEEEGRAQFCDSFSVALQEMSSLVSFTSGRSMERIWGALRSLVVPSFGALQRMVRAEAAADGFDLSALSLKVPLMELGRMRNLLQAAILALAAGDGDGASLLAVGTPRNYVFGTTGLLELGGGKSHLLRGISAHGQGKGSCPSFRLRIRRSLSVLRLSMCTSGLRS